MKQLTIFDQETKTEMVNPWWTGLPCKKDDYFDLLAQGIHIKWLSLPWLCVTEHN